MSSEVVELRELSAHILQVTLQDRVNKNTFSEGLLSGLIDAFERIRASDRYRVVVLTGYDTYFCSGGTKEMLMLLHEGKAKFTDVNIYAAPLDCEIPVIAAMQGHGIGGGLVFGLFADFVVLSRESIYTTNFMKYGFTPGMGATCILPNKLGAALAAELLLGARTYHGSDLEKRGVSFPVLPRSEVLAYAHELARDIALKPRESLIALKSHLVRELRAQLPDYIERETAMHAHTFHQPEVKSRIQASFGQ
jgi:polyketide biosynthesis enoyl-CoA hydratase PksI